MSEKKQQKKQQKKQEKKEEKKEEKKAVVTEAKKAKVTQTDKYYKIKADFGYLLSYNYKITKEIGRGGYGVVYKAININSTNEQEYAIKINFNTVSRELIYAEMAFLLLVKNRENLPKLVNLFVHHDITHIVLEYFKFKPFITFFNTFTIEEVKHYILELLIGLRNLKELGIYHRDIKPGNFLYNPDTKRGMIIDFGLAEIDIKYQNALETKYSKLKEQKKDLTEFEQTLKIYRRLGDCLKIIGRNKIGTETYMPLESILHHSQQSYQSDIWPVGVILLQFVVRKYNIFNNVRMVNKPNNVKNCYYINYIVELANFFGSQEVIDQCKNLGYELKLPKDIEEFKFRTIAAIDGYDDVLDQFLYRILALNPDKRFTVEQAIGHRFFDSIRAEHEPKK